MYVQTPYVELQLYRFNEKDLEQYESLTPENNSGLISYNFEKNIHNLSGEFSLSLKDTNKYFSEIKTLDMVKILEGGKLVFCGVVESVTFSKSATQGNMVVVKGKEICHLLEMFFISYDLSSMIFLNNNEKADVQNIEFKLAVNNGTKPALIKDSLKTVYNDFSNAAANSEKYGMGFIKAYIDRYLEDDFFVCEDTLKFDYPISTNLFQEGSEVSFIDFIRNLLHSSVYEIFGIIDEKEMSKIKVRQVPFDKESWKKLQTKAITIDTDFLTSYSLRKSCEEVYTTFISYLNNSPESSETNQRAMSLENKPHVIVNEHKFKRYGYKPLKVNFVGFNNNCSSPETSEEYENQIKEQSDLVSNLELLNKDLNEWYSKLDEMLTGSISLVNQWKDFIQVGEVIKFNDNYFYVTSVSHNWKYGSNGTITLTVDRGGRYKDGVFADEGDIYK